MDSDMVLLREEICQEIDRVSKAAEPRSQFDEGYTAAMRQAVHLIDKIRTADTDDYDQHRFSGLLEED